MNSAARKISVDRSLRAETPVARALARSRAPRAILTAQMAVFAGAGCNAFLVAYGVLHALHVAGVEPSFVAKLSPIPLFSTFAASSLFATTVGAAVATIPCAPSRVASVLARGLTVVCVLFTVEMIALP